MAKERKSAAAVMAGALAETENIQAEPSDLVPVSFRLPKAENEYLTEMGYVTRSNRTQYLIKLIDEDMKRNNR